MKQSLTKFILAIITQDPGLVAGGGAPVYCPRSQRAGPHRPLPARVTEGVVHDLENGVYVLVKH